MSTRARDKQSKKKKRDEINYNLEYKKAKLEDFKRRNNSELLSEKENFECWKMEIGGKCFEMRM